MKSKKAMVLLTSVSILLLCCKATQSLTPADADVKVADAHWSGTTMANLTQGYNIYSDKCTECHGTKKPQDFTLEEWSTIMPEMGRKAHLDSNQYNLVYHYILAKRETILSAKK